jgi:hypothetical protein
MSRIEKHARIILKRIEEFGIDAIRSRETAGEYDYNSGSYPDAEIDTLQCTMYGAPASDGEDQDATVRVKRLVGYIAGVPDIAVEDGLIYEGQTYRVENPVKVWRAGGIDLMTELKLIGV